MKAKLITLIALAVPIVAGAQVFNRAPLRDSPYAQLPLGSIEPSGWLQEQLRRQADGLTGHLDEVYPQVCGDNNAWLGGDGDAWERGPYWIDGLLPLAYILHDEALIAKARKWVEAMLASQREDGYFGPAEDHPFVYGLQRGKARDWWPKMVALKILQQYYMATGDARVIDCLTNYFHYQLSALSSCPLDHWSDWGRWRGADNTEVVLWLYNITGDGLLLELAGLLHSQTVDWTSIFEDGSIFHRQGSVHCVNLAQGFKAPAVWWQYSGEEKELKAQAAALEEMRHTVGFPTGLWAGDEMLHFGMPTRGSELCTAVEMMYSLEESLRITGDVAWADCLERVAYNALPAQVSDDFNAKQYYQQTNQVSCTLGAGSFSTPHDGTDVVFGTLNGYPCCLCNMHQGWPKFTQNLWYATPDGGLAALVYAPSKVRAKVAGGIDVIIEESTCYPFREDVSFSVGFTRCRDRKATFPLRFRVPGWCREPEVLINGEPQAVSVSDGIICIEREWRRKDIVTLHFPMELQVEEWYDNAWSIVRGPLVYALKMEEEWAWKPFSGGYHGDGAWEVTSPSAWNYCLMRDSFSPESCKVVYSDSVAPYPWNLSGAPVHITVPARTLPGWTNIDSVAYWTEDGVDYGEETAIELIPYGCTTLRIAEFPTRIVPWDVDYR